MKFHYLRKWSLSPQLALEVADDLLVFFRNRSVVALSVATAFVEFFFAGLFDLDFLFVHFVINLASGRVFSRLAFLSCRSFAVRTGALRGAFQILDFGSGFFVVAFRSSDGFAILIDLGFSILFLSRIASPTLPALSTLALTLFLTLLTLTLLTLTLLTLTLLTLTLLTLTLLTLTLLTLTLLTLTLLTLTLLTLALLTLALLTLALLTLALLTLTLLTLALLALILLALTLLALILLALTLLALTLLALALLTLAVLTLTLLTLTLLTLTLLTLALLTLTLLTLALLTLALLTLTLLTLALLTLTLLTLALLTLTLLTLTLLTLTLLTLALLILALLIFLVLPLISLVFRIGKNFNFQQLREGFRSRAARVTSTEVDQHQITGFGAQLAGRDQNHFAVGSGTGVRNGKLHTLDLRREALLALQTHRSQSLVVTGAPEDFQRLAFLHFDFVAERSFHLHHGRLIFQHLDWPETALHRERRILGLELKTPQSRAIEQHRLGYGFFARDIDLQSVFASCYPQISRSHRLVEIDRENRLGSDPSGKLLGVDFGLRQGRVGRRAQADPGFRHQGRTTDQHLIGCGDRIAEFDLQRDLALRGGQNRGVFPAFGKDEGIIDPGTRSAVARHLDPSGFRRGANAGGSHHPLALGIDGLAGGGEDLGDAGRGGSRQFRPGQGQSRGGDGQGRLGDDGAHEKTETRSRQAPESDLQRSRRRSRTQLHLGDFACQGLQGGGIVSAAEEASQQAALQFRVGSLQILSLMKKAAAAVENRLQEPDRRNNRRQQKQDQADATPSGAEGPVEVAEKKRGDADHQPGAKTEKDHQGLLGDGAPDAVRQQGSNLRIFTHGHFPICCSNLDLIPPNKQALAR